MPIHKRSINGPNGYTDYKHMINNYNDSNNNNYSHKENVPTNLNLTSITLEDIDMAVYNEFNKRFRIADREIGLLLLDAELTSMQNQNYEQFDIDKGFLNLPFFIMGRIKTTPIGKTNPSYKPVIYAVPKQTANGIVIEEYITEGPINYEIIYELKFISNYREYTNQMQQQMGYYFRNKRNMIVYNSERWVIGPVDQGTLGEEEIINRESVDQRTLYLTTFTLKVWAYTRDLSNMQKRLRPNKFTLDITVKDSVKTESSTDTILVERVELDNSQFPDHPITDPPKQNNPFKNSL